MADVAHWRMEKSAEGIMLVYGDSKYEQDPPRVATALESALLSELRGAVEDRDLYKRALGFIELHGHKSLVTDALLKARLDAQRTGGR